MAHDGELTASVCRNTSKLRVSLTLPGIADIPQAFPQAVPPFVSHFLSPVAPQREEPHGLHLINKGPARWGTHSGHMGLGRPYFPPDHPASWGSAGHTWIFPPGLSRVSSDGRGGAW